MFLLEGEKAELKLYTFIPTIKNLNVYSMISTIKQNSTNDRPVKYVCHFRVM